MLHGLGHLEFTFKQVYNTNTSSSSEVQLLFFKGSHLFLLKYLGIWLVVCAAVLCVAAVGYVVSLFFLSAAPAPQLGCLLIFLLLASHKLASVPLLSLVPQKFPRISQWKLPMETVLLGSRLNRLK